MTGFPMCGPCAAEYGDPANRRFHAQPIACRDCGPRLRAADAQGRALDPADPLAWFAELLRGGAIGAVKGLGGYHLACDATTDAAVARLRSRKHREEKPFAVMVAGLEDAERLCLLDDAEVRLLTSPARPVVLLRRRESIPIAPSVAPGNPCLGVMLPYTPLHELLLRLAAGPLVMTSGNQSDEPIAYEDEDALRRLAGIADGFLMHDRPIEIRCDDSVTRVVSGIELPLRRSRGHAPRPIPLPVACTTPTLAVGGHYKATFALGRGRSAFLSHHIGELDQAEAYRAFVREIAHYRSLFQIEPRRVAHDLHPDYASTRLAVELGLERVPVQHHHAHLAACMAENGLAGPVLGITFDGTGYGDDGTLWGGEFLIGGYRSVRRAARLRPVPMPGGEASIHEPWRMALATLTDGGIDPGFFEKTLDPQAVGVVRRMIDRSFNAPLTSSAGRLWDAVAALAGVRTTASYEAQAAIELEWLAQGSADEDCYEFGRSDDALMELDTRPLIRAVATDARNGVEARTIARRFHTTVVELAAQTCVALRRRGAPEDVVLSGGVFQNALFLREVTFRLTREGFRVYRHQLVPPNDGGLSLGQLAVAAAQEGC
jgi:hydrogenase maturation protein HypF